MMGFNCSMILFENCSQEKALDLLNFDGTDVVDEYQEASFSGAINPDAGFILWQNWHRGMLQEDDFKHLSMSTRIISCDVSETMMHATTTCWEAGNLVWRVHHEGDENPQHLEVSEDAPSFVQSIIKDVREQEKLASDDQVDFLFEVPVLTFKKLAGVRHDEQSDLVFFELRNPNKPQKKFWQFWK